jgi:hypothetical protein
MITIEERISEYCTIPQPEKRFCEHDGCKTALARANKDSLCYRHAQIEAAKKRQLNWERKYFAEYRKAPRPKPAASLILLRSCFVMGCDNEITHTKRNRSGRCSDHNHLARGTQMKDGSIPKPHTEFSQRIAETLKRKVAA